MFTEKKKLNKEIKESFVKLDSKIMLVTKASGKNYSIEAGLHDGEKNYDHHNSDFEGLLSPCEQVISCIRYPEKAVIEITHIDADTYITLQKMIIGTISFDLDLSIIGEIDCNGTSSVIKRIKEENRKTDEKALYYYLGVGALVRKINFPRVANESQDVTEYIKQMFMYSIDEIISLGKEVYEKGEIGYKKCLQKWDFLDKLRKNKIGLFFVDSDDSFDPSRPYVDDYNIVVVYRSHWMTISIYCSPDSQCEFAGKTIEGILFQGHPKACGSPRGEKMLPKHAEIVFKKLLKKEGK